MMGTPRVFMKRRAAKDKDDGVRSMDDSDIFVEVVYHIFYEEAV